MLNHKQENFDEHKCARSYSCNSNNLNKRSAANVNEEPFCCCNINAIILIFKTFVLLSNANEYVISM